MRCQIHRVLLKQETGFDDQTKISEDKRISLLYLPSKFYVFFITSCRQSVEVGSDFVEKRFEKKSRLVFKIKLEGQVFQLHPSSRVFNTPEGPSRV